MERFRRMIRYLSILGLTVALGAAVPVAQQSGQTSPESSPARAAAQGAEPPAVALPDGPQVFTDSGGRPFRVVPIKGLRHPWALAFLPNSDILVTELGGGSFGSSETGCSIRSRSPACQRRTRVSGVRG